MKPVLVALIIAWAVAFFGSFMVFYLTPASDFGFTRGMNKVEGFMIWQSVAAGLAVVCLVLRWNATDSTLRKWAAVPAIALGAMLIGFAALFVWVSL